MKATILDLRYKMKKVLKALERREIITILYHGKEKGTIYPKNSGNNQTVTDHPFFGMMTENSKSVNEVMEELRSSRTRDI